MHLKVVLVFVIVAVNPSMCLDINSIFNTKSVLQLSGTSARLIESIASGAQTALNYCQKAFKWEKWNCPEKAFSREQNQVSTREAAYISAIVSSGIVHAITKNCSKGEIKACKCHNKPQNILDENPLIQKVVSAPGPKPISETKEVDWTWGGCSDDVTYAMEISKHVLNRFENGTDLQNTIDSHNNNIGRQIIRETMVQKCRCHGVSGSCSLQTCWVQVAPFQVIATKLKEKYNKAVIVSQNDVSQEEDHSEVHKNDLIYMDHSPNYCLENPTINWPGTKGRTCSRLNLKNATIAEKKSCRHLCRSCGYKVRRHKKKITTKCNCSFRWCCEVKCDTCEEVIDEFYCA